MRTPGPKRQERKMVFQAYLPSGALAYYRKLKMALMVVGQDRRRIGIIPRSKARELGLSVIS